VPATFIATLRENVQSLVKFQRVSFTLENVMKRLILLAEIGL